VIGGPTALNHGIEINPEVHEFSCKRATEFERLCPDISEVHLCCGNVFEMAEGIGAGAVKYDRIYVGASCPEDLKDTLCLSLKVGGVLIAPVNDELVKVTRLDDTQCSAAFDHVVLSGVRFVNMVNHPSVGVTPVLPTPVWTPQSACRFPASFKKSAKAIFLVAGRAPLPQHVWLEVMSFADRAWFDRKPTEADKLRLRLEIETKARFEAEEVAREAKRARSLAQRECERFRSIANRLERQLRSHLPSAGGLVNLLQGTLAPPPGTNANLDNEEGHLGMTEQLESPSSSSVYGEYEDDEEVDFSFHDEYSSDDDE